jgi:hypothetical protein
MLKTVMGTLSPQQRRTARVAAVVETLVEVVATTPAVNSVIQSIRFGGYGVTLSLRSEYW